MKKKLIIGLSVFALFVAGILFYMNYRNRTMSPPGETSISNDGMEISIKYSRPSVRGRLVFGDSEDALQPYGVYWRLGANESTVITFNKDVKFNGEEVKAGTYKIYAYPGKDEFDIRLNKEFDTWGYSESDNAEDVLQTQVAVLVNDHVEQYTMELAKDGDGAVLLITWDKIKLSIPIARP